MQKLRLFGMNGVFVLMLTCMAGAACGQQPGYLILVDAENQQPFTASIGGDLLQSTAHGHLLIPRLEDSSYRLIIRFQGRDVADRVFPVVIHKKDQGFQLKETDSSCVLYNWQSGETIHPVKEQDSTRLLNQGVKREDGFSRLMAAVVNDSSVMYDTYAGHMLLNDSSSGKGISQDSAVLVSKNRKKRSAALPDSSAVTRIGKAPGTDTAKLMKPVLPVMTAKREIRKLREVSLKISRKMVFLDTSPDGGKDTITLFVYFEKPGPGMQRHLHEDPMITARRLLRNDTAELKPAVRDKAGHEPAGTELAKTTEKNKDPVKQGDRIIADTTRAARNPAGLCAQAASDADMEALRSAILIRNSEQEKISVASGAFAMKCFSVAQIRLLADLFVLDRDKYKLLDAAHLHVSDPDHFPELSDMLQDKAYLKKFRVLIQKRG